MDDSCIALYLKCTISSNAADNANRGLRAASSYTQVARSELRELVASERASNADGIPDFRHERTDQIGTARGRLEACRVRYIDWCPNITTDADSDPLNAIITPARLDPTA
ncbi:MAG: hypothetical protein NTU67_07320, partial [Gemmatimonadetes bacterium]|nr:hypothetical protein [Gemmatimonadota bacterium]